MHSLDLVVIGEMLCQELANQFILRIRFIFFTKGRFNGKYQKNGTKYPENPTPARNECRTEANHNATENQSA